MNDFITDTKKERPVEKGDICYHKLYGFGEVLDVYRDENNRNIVQCRFNSGFQYFNYQYFTEIVTLFPKDKTFPVCPVCGQHPTETEGAPCLACRKKAEEAASKTKKKPDGKVESQGYFDEEEENADEELNSFYDERDLFGLEEDDDDDDDDDENEDEQFLRHGFSVGEYNK